MDKNKYNLMLKKIGDELDDIFADVKNTQKYNYICLSSESLTGKESQLYRLTYSIIGKIEWLKKQIEEDLFTIKEELLKRKIKEFEKDLQKIKKLKEQIKWN